MEKRLPASTTVVYRTDAVSSHIEPGEVVSTRTQAFFRVGQNIPVGDDEQFRKVVQALATASMPLRIATNALKDIGYEVTEFSGVYPMVDPANKPISEIGVSSDGATFMAYQYSPDTNLLAEVNGQVNGLVQVSQDITSGIGNTTHHLEIIGSRRLKIVQLAEDQKAA